MQSKLRSFSQYLTEKIESLDLDRKLKGYTADQLIERISQLMDVLSDSVRFGVPSDTLGRATTYRDANSAIQKIRDMQLYYEKKGEDVRFYCWSISYRGSWEATQSLKEKIESSGGFGEEKMNLNLKKVISYFTENKEDSDNVATISISMDSMSIRKAMNQDSGETDSGEETNTAQIEGPRENPA